MEVKGKEPVLMLDGKAANRTLPKREGAKPGWADTATFFTLDTIKLISKSHILPWYQKISTMNFNRIQTSEFS